jgi:HlyD family secretion protein
VKKLLVLLILVVLAIAGAVYALNTPFWSSLSAASETPRLETSFPVLYGQLLETVTGQGTVQPQETLVVSTDQVGRVVKLLHDVNDVVEEGEELLQIDDQVQQQKVRQAQAALETAEAAVESANATVAEAESKREAAKILLERAQEQLAKGTLTQRAVDQGQAETNYAEKAVRAAQAMVKTAEAKRREAKEAVALAELADELTHVAVPTVEHPAHAQSAGEAHDLGQVLPRPARDRPRRKYTVLERKVSLNQLIGPPASAQLFILSPNVRQVQVNAQIAEGDIDKVAVGMKAYFTVSAYENHTFTGTVTEVRPLPTPSGVPGSTTINYTALITVDDRPGQDREWRLQPGMTLASLDIVYRTVPAKEGAGVWLVPDAALNLALDKDYWEPGVKDKPNPPDDQKWVWVTDKQQHTAARAVIVKAGPSGKVLDADGTGLRAETYTEVKEWVNGPPQGLEPDKEAPFDVVTGAPPPRKNRLAIPSLIKS